MYTVRIPVYPEKNANLRTLRDEFSEIVWCLEGSGLKPNSFWALGEADFGPACAVKNRTFACYGTNLFSVDYFSRGTLPTKKG